MMEAVRLGATGPTVSVVGLGCMSMSEGHGASDDRESLATIRAAVEGGITLFDTGDYYGCGHNELLLREALGSRRRDVTLSVKFGALRDPAGRWTGLDCRPTAVKNAVTYSLKRLGTEYIDIYQPGRLDPAVPIEDTVGAVADLIQDGYVRYLGLSEMSLDIVERAHAVHPVTALEVEYSFLARGIEPRTLPRLRELGIGVVAYGVFTHGLLSGRVRAREDVLGPGDFRAFLPQFSAENITGNLQLAREFALFAGEQGLSPAQLASAWVRSRGADVVPVLGARNRISLADILDGANAVLDPAATAELERRVRFDRVRGDRYPPDQMEMVHR